MRIFIIAAFAVTTFAQKKEPAAKGPNGAVTIKQLEHDWSDAVKSADADKLNQILADDWTGIFYDGTKATKKEYIESYKSGKSKLESFEFGPMDVKVLGNVSVVQGSDTEKSTTDGKDSSGKYAWTDVFVKRGDKWEVVRSQLAKVK